MARVWSILAILLACLIMVGTVNAQEKKGNRKPADQRFDDMEKTVKHDPLTGVLTKDEFVTALKGTRMADRAEEFFKNIKKADEGKVTKAEYVQAMKDRYGKKKKKDADKTPPADSK
jgi:hypothetical protein